VEHSHSDYVPLESRGVDGVGLDLQHLRDFERPISHHPSARNPGPMQMETLPCKGCTGSISGVHPKDVAPCVIYSRGLEPLAHV
jgi:hypothetical protein